MKFSESLLIMLVAIVVCLGDVIIGDINPMQVEAIDASAVLEKLQATKEVTLSLPVPISQLYSKPSKPTRRPTKFRGSRTPTTTPIPTNAPTPSPSPNDLPTGYPSFEPTSEEPHYWFGLVWPPTLEPTI